MLTLSTGNALRPRLQRQNGSGLIEVLVSIVLMSFGLLGIAGMYNYTISANKSASSRLTAAMLATDFAEIVRANPDGFKDGSYDHSMGTFSVTASTVGTVAAGDKCAFPDCTKSTLATQDIALMKARVKAYLPAGEFETKRVGSTNQFDIWIVWVEGKGVSGSESNFDNCPSSLATQTPTPNPFPRCIFTRVSL
jgi:type IV pilus assembly protein PilV